MNGMRLVLTHIIKTPQSRIILSNRPHCTPVTLLPNDARIHFIYAIGKQIECMYIEFEKQTYVDIKTSVIRIV